MIPLFSVEDVRDTDKRAIEGLGIPSIVLMENAASNIYKAVRREFESLTPGKSIGFICGKGNNGGDGFAVARKFFDDGFNVTLLHIGGENDFSRDGLINYTILKKLSREYKRINLIKYSSVKDVNKLKNCAAVFDAMLGSGTTGELREPYASIVKAANKLDALRIAIDIPTGIDADKGSGSTAFDANFTITLGALKKGLFFGEGFARGGETVLGRIGISDEMFGKYEPDTFLIEPDDAFAGLPVKSVDMHKYSAGKVLNLAGSYQFPGAAVLTAVSALKAGAGASVLAIPESIKEFTHGQNYPELVVEAFSDEGRGSFDSNSLKELKERISWADAVAMGPGISREKETLAAAVELLDKYKQKKIVVDADALFAVAEKGYKQVNLKNRVLTPHSGEFANMLHISTGELNSNPLYYGRSFAKQTGCWLVLKGHRSMIFTPAGKVYINTTGNPGMAKFGTGDVLTGVLSGFLAQSDDIEAAVVSAVYLHSLAADLLEEIFTEYGYTSSQTMEAFPEAVKFLRKSVTGIDQQTS